MQNKQELTTQQLIKETVNQICELIASVRTNGAYPAENFVPEIISTIASKSAEVERERILNLACDVSDELTNANVPVIHPGELGEHGPDDVWEVAGNQTAHAFYGMLEQKSKESQ